MPYAVIKQWLAILAIVTRWWIKRIGPKAFFGLMGLSTLLAVFLNYKY